MSSKKFVNDTFTELVDTNWNLGGQKCGNSPMICLGKTKRKDSGIGYHTAVNNLKD